MASTKGSSGLDTLITGLSEEIEKRSFSDKYIVFYVT